MLLFAACKDDEAHIEVVNGVHNVRLQNISFVDFPLGYDLLPGESTGKKKLSEEYDDISFPLSGQIVFYMLGTDGSKVYLKTKESFRLNKNDNLQVVISDNTEVVNMVTGSIRSFTEAVDD